MFLPKVSLAYLSQLPAITSDVSGLSFKQFTLYITILGTELHKRVFSTLAENVTTPLITSLVNLVGIEDEVDSSRKYLHKILAWQ